MYYAWNYIFLWLRWLTREGFFFTIVISFAVDGIMHVDDEKKYCGA